MHTKQLKRLARNPKAYMDFATRGVLPSLVRPSGPLIDVLRSLSQRDRAQIRGLRVDRDLGYEGMRVFHSAEHALRWCAPDDTMVDGDCWPAESWRNKRFSKRLTVGDVLSKASSCPAALASRFGVSNAVSENATLSR